MGYEGQAAMGITANPVVGIERFREEKRERWLSVEELQRLATALDEYPDHCATQAEVSEKQRVFLPPKHSALLIASALRCSRAAAKGKPLKRSGLTLTWHAGRGQNPLGRRDLWRGRRA